ncbi:MAG: heavy metal sensor histidine kinase [Burkholderiaceae bacterium]
MLRRFSLTARLTTLYTLVSALVLIGLGTLVMVATERHFVELDRDYLKDKIAMVRRMVHEAGASETLQHQLDTTLVSHHGLYIELRQGTRLVYSTLDGVSPPPALPASASKTPADWTIDGQTLRGMNVAFAAPPTADGSTPPPLQLLVALDTVHHRHFMDSLLRTLGLYLLATISLSGLLGWWAARRGLSPLRVMKERALAVTGQKLDQRMPVDAVPVEFADLAQSLNTMLARLEADFARLQEFSSDLAHELRTPINNLLTQTQVSLAHKRDVAAYQDILASNAEEFQRLARMVSDMLLLAKTEHGIELVHREPVSLHHEVRDLLDFYDAVSDEKQLRMALEGQTTVPGDRLMLRRAISNLISNAIRHSPQGCEVSIVLHDDPQAPTLCVTNDGPTIAPEHLPRLFDRFYRVDKARGHPESDGTGLGLSITKAIMVAHGGSVSVDSDHGRTRFCLVFQGRVDH